MASEREGVTPHEESGYGLDKTEPRMLLTSDLMEVLAAEGPRGDDHPLEGDADPEGAEPADDDGVFAAAFDRMFRERYATALDAIGPSTAIEDRVLANLRAAQAERVGDAPGDAPVDVAPAAEPAHLAEPVALAAADGVGDAPAPLAQAPEQLAPGEQAPPAHLEEGAAARPEEAAPAHLEEVAPAHLEEAAPAHFEEAASGESFQQAEPAHAAPAVAASVAEAAQGSSARPGVGGLAQRVLVLVGRERRTFSIAAAVLGGLIVVGVARGVISTIAGRSGAPALSAPAATEAAAEAEAHAEQEVVGEETTLLSPDGDGMWRAELCQDIELSSRERLHIVTADGVPQMVDPTRVGEFVEAAVAHGDDIDLECDVFRIIVQSEGDGDLYAVSFADDGMFYLASSEKATSAQ